MKTTIEKLQRDVQHRDVTIDKRNVDEGNRTIEIAFSSETPVERWYGNEILDHAPGAVRLGRMESGGAVLVDHEARDHVGVVESVSIDSDRVGRALVRLGESERASEIFKDIVDGIRRHISVGYRIHQVIIEENKDSADVYRVTDWEPHEISFVSVPADASVGIGRSVGDEPETEVKLETETEVIHPMEDRTLDKNDKQDEAEVVTITANDRSALEGEVRKNELARITDITEIASKFEQVDLGKDFIKSGGSVDEFNKVLLERIGTGKHKSVPDADIGLTDKEIRAFSFVKAINALANPSSRSAQEDAAFEFECSEAAAVRSGVAGVGIRVPVDILRQSIQSVMGKRDLSVGTATAGGHTVSTDLLASSFIDILRNNMVVAQRATTLTDLVGNIAIPRQTGGATAYWVAEAVAITESQQAFDQVTLSPETVGAFTDFSRKLMLQSSIDVEAFVRSDLTRVLALEIDRVCINGSGSSNQPEGILNVTGIGDVAGGTNGAAPDWADIVDLESAVAADNANVGDLVYVTNQKVRGRLKKTFVDSGSNAERVWDTRAGNQPLNGLEALVTNQVPSNLVKGSSGAVCSAILYGNFSDLILAMWGGLDITVDPYTGSTSGNVRVVALQDVDVAVRHPESFAAMLDALTA